MKWMQIVAFVSMVLAIFLHGFFPTIFIIDKFTIGLLFLMAIPLLAPYLKKAKWFGAEFEFREGIREANKLVKQSEVESKESGPLSFSTFDTASARKALEIDPNLALAALRIEIEQKLSSAVDNLQGVDKVKRRSIREYTRVLVSAQRIFYEQAKALHTISGMCNSAIHGHSVSKGEAIEIIEITERLNSSLANDYSIHSEGNMMQRD